MALGARLGEAEIRFSTAQFNFFCPAVREKREKREREREREIERERESERERERERERRE